MNKLIIQHNGEDIEFLMHDFTESQFRIKAEFVARILKGITYPIVNDLKPKIIFDIGAHIGATSAFFSMQYPKSQIFSFEPTTINFSLLEKNMKYFSNVEIFKKGVFDKSISQKIYINSTNPGSNSIHERWQKFDYFEYANFIDLKEFLEENDIKNIDILKIDTEGCEINILKSILSYIKKINVIYLEYHSEKQGFVIRKLLNSSHDIKQHVLSGANRVPVESSIVGKINSYDIIYDENVIIAANQIINEEQFLELKKNGVSSIDVESKELGEVCFVNKNLKE